MKLPDLIHLVWMKYCFLNLFEALDNVDVYFSPLVFVLLSPIFEYIEIYRNTCCLQGETFSTSIHAFSTQHYKTTLCILEAYDEEEESAGFGLECLQSWPVPCREPVEDFVIKKMCQQYPSTWLMFLQEELEEEKQLKHYIAWYL